MFICFPYVVLFYMFLKFNYISFYSALNFVTFLPLYLEGSEIVFLFHMNFCGYKLQP